MRHQCGLVEAIETSRFNIANRVVLYLFGPHEESSKRPGGKGMMMTLIEAGPKSAVVEPVVGLIIDLTHPSSF